MWSRVAGVSNGPTVEVEIGLEAEAVSLESPVQGRQHGGCTGTPQPAEVLEDGRKEVALAVARLFPPPSSPPPPPPPPTLTFVLRSAAPSMEHGAQIEDNPDQYGAGQLTETK